MVGSISQMSKVMGSTNWIEYLNDPYLVARFQAAFGVIRNPNFAQAQNLSNTKNEALMEDADTISVPSEEPQYQHRSRKEWPSENIEYTIENRFWYYLAKLGAAMGDEVFYACFFPFWFWNVDGAVMRRCTMIWGILMYIGQGLKDIIRWPRPSAPPVVRLEKKWELEYGMPSTHAIIASSVPFSVLFFTSSRYQYEFSYGLGIAIIWCIVVCTSRIYLGMHSILDVLAGLSIVGALFPWVTSIADSLDPFILKHEYGGIFLLVAGIFLVVMSPGGDRWTPARGDTCGIIATCVGLSMGAWANFQLGIIRGPALDPPYPVLWPSYGMLGLSLLRMVIGLVIVSTTKSIVKTSAIFTLGELFKRASKSLSYHPSSPKREVFVELTYKFVTYFVLGFNVVFLCPVVFRLIGIERPTFHTEV